MTGKLQTGSSRHAHGVLFLLKVLDTLAPSYLLFALVSLTSVKWSREYMLTGILGSLMLHIALRFVDAYRSWQGASVHSETFSLIRAWFLVVIGLLFLGWALQETEFYSRLVMGCWIIGVPLLLGFQHLLANMILRLITRKEDYARRAVIVGAGVLGNELAKNIDKAGPALGIHVVGFLDDSPEKCQDSAGKPVLGRPDDLERFIAEQGIDMVFLALPMHAANRIKEVFEACQQTTVSVMLVPDLFMFELRDARLQDIAGMPVFALCETPFWGVHGVAKRIEDLFLASLSLLCLWPLLLLIAIGVKMSSPGPVLFRQRRHGLDDKVFYVYKFRTMTVCEDDGNIQQAQRDDPRVTRFGAFLRKTSLDELPQLFNVLKGEMSLVGPRPHALAHNEEYKQLINRYVWRHKVRPGLTGWAQVNGWRGETDTLEKMQKRVEHDLWYIANWSIWLDIRILLMTVWIVLSRKNAY